MGVTWKQNPSDSITITRASLVARAGPGMGNVGDQYIATIQRNSDGQRPLYGHPVGVQGQVISVCTEAGRRRIRRVVHDGAEVSISLALDRIPVR